MKTNSSSSTKEVNFWYRFIQDSTTAAAATAVYGPILTATRRHCVCDGRDRQNVQRTIVVQWTSVSSRRRLAGSLLSSLPLQQHCRLPCVATEIPRYMRLCGVRRWTVWRLGWVWRCKHFIVSVIRVCDENGAPGWTLRWQLDAMF